MPHEFERVNVLQKERLAGHNVLHLIYPIKTTEKSISDCLENNRWEVLYKNDEDGSRMHQENFFIFFQILIIKNILIRDGIVFNGVVFLLIIYIFITLNHFLRYYLKEKSD